jgi:tetratricopeptide (TPR) repeat protein
VQQSQSQYADPRPTQSASGSDAGAEYYSEATSAFHNGQYRDALRLANHAAVESPQNAKAHELMSLSMFASGDYRAAAAEAHAALAFGPPAAWATVYGYYGDDATYTNQLRALEKYSRENLTAADARFLRAYQYLILGHEQAAIEQLRETVKLTPQDRLATELLKKYGEPGAEKQPVLPPAPSPIPANPGAGGGPRPVDGIDS